MVIMKYEQIYMKCYLALLFFLHRSLCCEIVIVVIIMSYLFDNHVEMDGCHSNLLFQFN